MIGASAIRTEAVLIGLSVCFLVGCDNPPLHPAKGMVLVDGVPAEGVIVLLNPVASEGQPASTVTPTGRTDSKGSYDLSSKRAADGAPAGAYRITLVWPEPDAQGASPSKGVFGPPRRNDIAKDRFEGRYADPDESEWTVTIVEGQNDLPPIEIE